MKRNRLLFFFLLPALLLFGCAPAGQEKNPKEKIESFLSLLPSHPAGRLYESGLSEDEEGHPLTRELLRALFAREDGSLPTDGRVESMAVYLASGQDERFEAILFICYGSADTDAVRECCLRRAQLAASCGELRAEDARIYISGRYVFYCLSAMPDAAEQAMRRIL